ncbi:hypothetical protein GRX01_00815 [Halobaculum sp. WSA2]|uniref:Uncharacterized protein n=1 Tax=Halobaculum saliterrae TaxID=2073113 RepID=A0A6B0ST97_9EURY|nr:hypothetical protein [Halobaculum saliterrae]MXR39903.1 hypothetical protein [Halobaculum saliterrae]
MADDTETPTHAETRRQDEPPTHDEDATSESDNGHTRPESDGEAAPATLGEESGTDADAPIADEASVAKVYYEDGEPVVLAAAFVIEDWPWVVGFDQIGTDGYDYVSIPTERIVGVRSPRYAVFSHNGHRVTAYGVMDEEIREFRDLLPL